MDELILNDLNTLLEMVERPIFDDIRVAESLRSLVKQIIMQHKNEPEKQMREKDYLKDKNLTLQAKRTDRDILLHTLFELRTMLYEEMSEVMRIQLETLKREIEEHLELGSERDE